MGRRAEGWKLRRRPEPDGPFYVRFTHQGARHEFPTGTRDPVRAGELAPKIYAEEIKRIRSGESQATSVNADTPTKNLFAAWLMSVETTHAESTQAVLKIYVKSHFLPAFETVADFTTAKVANLMRARLGAALRDTVRKELRALGSFFKWATEQGYLSSTPAMPKVPPNATGTRTGTRKAQPTECSPQSADAVVLALPEWSSERDDRFPVAAYFRVLWETSLRPSTIQRLSVPDNYRKGETELRITEEVDKIRYARSVPLTLEARAALDAVAPEQGLIFGAHDWRRFLNPAAERAGVELAAHLSPYDLRHGRLTQFAETGNLPGAAYLAGHKRVTTTNRYARPNVRSARAVLGAISGANSGAGTGIFVGAIGFEPTTPTVSSTRLCGIPASFADRGDPESAGNYGRETRNGAADPQLVGQLSEHGFGNVALWDLADWLALTAEEASVS
jgi:integrase